MKDHENTPKNNTLTIDPLRTPEETAKQLLIEPKTLAQWRSSRSSTLAFVKVGRLIRYRQSDIDAYIQAHVFGGTE